MKSFKFDDPLQEAADINAESKTTVSDQTLSPDHGSISIGGGVRNSNLRQTYVQITSEKVPPEIWGLLKNKKGMHIPHPRNANFTGRDELLTDLQAALLSGNEVALTHIKALTGLGGIGKTQLALEYSYRYQDDYDIVWWLRSELLSTLLDDYALMATSLKLPGWDSGDPNLMAEAARNFLETQSRWLLVFDNAQNSEDLMPHLPHGGGGHVIITSRNPSWGNLARPLEVARFERPESIEFLCKRTGQQDQGAADKLADALGDLPLALEQAGAYMDTTGKPLDEYLKAFQERKLKMLAKAKPSDYPYTVATTWNISFRAVRKEHPAAIGLLRLFSYLAPDEIPLAYLVKGSEMLPDGVASVLRHEDKRDEVLRALRCYSLISRSGDKISVHKLVQDVTCDSLALRYRKKWAGAAVKLLNNVFPHDTDKESWEKRSILLPHALMASKHAKDLQVDRMTTAHLFNQAGLYLQTRGEFVEAESAFNEALNIIRTDGLDCDTLAVANILNNLGKVLHDKGKLKEAKERFKEALDIFEKIHDTKHIATINNNLASVLRCHGDFQGARERYNIALKIDENIYGPNHPNVAVDINNFGLVLMDQHDYEEAKKYFERALRIGRKASSLGPKHPVVSNYLFNLGWIMHSQGRLRAAQRCYEKALKINREYYRTDDNHPSIALFLFNLGRVIYSQGGHDEGLSLIREAQQISTKFYGPDHPLTRGICVFLRSC